MSHDFIEGDSLSSDSWYQDSLIDELIEEGALTMTTATLVPSRGDTVIDYEAPEGIKTYKRAITALKDEYDGKLDGISVFKMKC